MSVPSVAPYEAAGRLLVTARIHVPMNTHAQVYETLTMETSLIEVVRTTQTKNLELELTTGHKA